jgi:hypothetical protein
MEERMRARDKLSLFFVSFLTVVAVGITLALAGALVFFILFPAPRCGGVLSTDGRNVCLPERKLSREITLGYVTLAPLPVHGESPRKDHRESAKRGPILE